MFWLWVGLATVGVLFLVWLAIRVLSAFLAEVRKERARELFKLQRDRLQSLFFEQAAASGKPRGLRWTNIDWEETLEFVKNRRNGQIFALVQVTIQFEAIPGSDMEGLPAVGNLRNATAVFVFEGGHWGAGGRALFNMNPDEAVGHLGGQFDRIG